MSDEDKAARKEWKVMVAGGELIQAQKKELGEKISAVEAEIEEFNAGKDLEDRGEVERAVFKQLEHDVGVVSGVIHGGAWQGNSGRRFLGMLECKAHKAGKKKLPKCFADTIVCMKKALNKIEDTKTAQAITYFLDDVFSGLCTRSYFVVKFLTQLTPCKTRAELQAGISRVRHGRRL